MRNRSLTFQGLLVILLGFGLLATAAAQESRVIPSADHLCVACALRCPGDRDIMDRECSEQCGEEYIVEDRMRCQYHQCLDQRRRAWNCVRATIQ